MAFHVRLEMQRLQTMEASMNSTASHTTLPAWMQDYIAWHSEQLQSLTAKNWRDHKFMISRCLDIDRACGGVSDRLKSLPVLMLLAAQSQRILLLHWSRPAALENFLLPTAFVNWSLPDYVPVKGPGTRLYTKLSTLAKAVDTNSTVPVLCARLQDQHGGSDYYNANFVNFGTERVFRKVFRSLFFTLFTPSKSVLRQLFLDLQGLSSGAYTAAHLRAYYGDHPVTDDQVRVRAINAVNCASQLRNDTAAAAAAAGQRQLQSHIVFLSDSALAVDYVEQYASAKQYPIVTIRRDTEPLHLDKADSMKSADYTAVFVDLLVMAHARCVSHGQGGFGRFGVLLSNDPMCFKKYVDTARFIECQWKDMEFIDPG